MDSSPAEQGPLVLVVFQFGKVASTSIVAAFNALDGVTAHQSHFLGDEPYRRTLEQVLDPSVSDYFFRHQLGQLTQNITISRSMARIAGGYEPGRVAVLSLAREHLDWARSALVQDAVGYLDLFDAISAIDAPGETLGPRARVRTGIRGMLRRIDDLVTECGSGEAFLDRIYRKDLARFAQSDFWQIPSGTTFFFTFLRPLLWYQIDFRNATNLDLGDLEQRPQFWTATSDNRTHYVLRYEDIADALPAIAGDLALATMPVLTSRNVSAPKPFADDIREALEGDEAMRLREHFAQTQYSKFFGYA